MKIGDPDLISGIMSRDPDLISTGIMSVLKLNIWFIPICQGEPFQVYRGFFHVHVIRLILSDFNTFPWKSRNLKQLKVLKMIKRGNIWGTRKEQEPDTTNLTLFSFFFTINDEERKNLTRYNYQINILYMHIMMITCLSNGIWDANYSFNFPI